MMITRLHGWGKGSSGYVEDMYGLVVTIVVLVAVAVLILLLEKKRAQGIERDLREMAPRRDARRRPEGR